VSEADRFVISKYVLAALADLDCDDVAHPEGTLMTTRSAGTKKTTSTGRTATGRARRAPALSAVGTISLAGRSATAGWVSLDLPTAAGGTSSWESEWPEWAYGVASAALLSNKRVWVQYDSQPVGSRLIRVLCTNLPA
jgi:hypothetical protein